MNEEANRQLVDRAYRMVQQGDIQSLLDLMAEDVEWQVPEMADVPFAGTWKGRREVGRFFRVVNEAQDVVEFELEHSMAEHDKVVVLGRFTMRVKATGRESRSAWVHVWTVTAGKVAGMREYVDTLAVSQAHHRE